jgi:phosphate acetyltransferase/phosphate butyryltransferase
VIAHGMWGAALISAVLGTRLPGAGTVYERQTLNFRAPIRAGDTLTTTVKVTARDERESLVTLDCTCVNQRGQTVIAGEAVVAAPTARIERSRSTLPQVRISVSQGDDLVRLLQLVRPLGPIRMAVVHPDRRRQPVGCARCTRGGAHRAGARRAARASRSGREGGRALARRRADRGAAGRALRRPARAVELAVQGTVGALMKGNLHTDELMGAVVASALRTSRRISHCFVMQTPAYPRRS